MIELAHHAAMLGISIDTGRLYDGDDPSYELFLWTLVGRVSETVRRQST